MEESKYIGRQEQARALIRNVNAEHSTLIIGGSGVGKTAFIDFIMPLLVDMQPCLRANKPGPGFVAFLKQIHLELKKHKLISDPWDEFRKGKTTNDDKASAIVEIIRKSNKKFILIIDDCNVVTPTNRPWLEELEELCVVIAVIEPKALLRNGTKRFWRRFDELQLDNLSKSETLQMAENCMNNYGVTADDKESYLRKIQSLSQGNPYEINRLVKYHSAESLVKVREINEHSDKLVDREVKQIALAPLALIFLVLLAGSRYMARARSDVDLMVISGFSMVALIIFSPWIRKSLKPRTGS